MSFTENLYLKRQIQQLQEENINLKNLINEYSFSTNKPKKFEIVSDNNTSVPSQSLFSRSLDLNKKMSSDRSSRKSKSLKRLKLPETEGDGPARMEDLYDYLGIKRPDVIS
jgi:hypothetical protein